VEALFCAYARTYDGQFGYIMRRNKGDRLSKIGFNARVEIGENPGLNAVLAEDVCIENVGANGNTQIISWTDPDYYEPTIEQPGFRKIGIGQYHKLKFDYLSYVQTKIT
jgi:hypothetical protein